MRLLLAITFFCVLCSASTVRELRIDPQVAYIHGAGGTHHLLVTAIFDDGAQQDVTAQVKIVSDSPDVIETTSDFQIRARKEGIAKVRAEFNGHRAEGAIEAMLTELQAARGLGQPEVDHFGHGLAIVRFDQDVGWLQVAVDDPFLVCVLHGRADLAEEGQSLG